MTLPTTHNLKEDTIYAFSASIGSSPVAAYARVGFRGQIVKLGAIAAGIITTSDCSIATTVTGTSITGGTFTLPVASAAAGQLNSTTPTALTTVTEDDYISFTPSGASGSSIPATFFAVITRA
jgi:hypothetical protein